MKRVLIIAPYFNEPEVIGAIRPRGLAKFLPSYGWEPVVLTATSSIESDWNFRVIEVEAESPHSKWKKFLGLRQDATLKEQLDLASHKNKRTFADHMLSTWAEIFVYPDMYKNWSKTALSTVDDELIDEVDAIFSTSPPPTAHLVAKAIKIRYKIPWIADFRDLWTQNANYQYGRIRRRFERNLETKIIAFADALTTVSAPLAEEMRKLHAGKEIFTVLNGFDPEQMDMKTPITDSFTITYTGALYSGKRDPEMLLVALNELRSDGSMNFADVSVDFFGRKTDWLERDIEKYQLQDVVKQNGPVSREIAIQAQKGSQLLLLLTWNDPGEAGILTGKLFDYLAAQRPIISVGTSGGDLEKILETTGAGIHVSSVDAIKRELKRAYQEFSQYGAVRYRGTPSKISAYDHKKMTKKIAELLDGVVS